MWYRQIINCRQPAMTTQQNSNQFIVISALGDDRPGIINRITDPISAAGCNINDSRMTILGGEFAVLMLVEGPWNTIAKLEEQIPALAQRLDLTITTKRTEPRRDDGKLLPYAVNVIALDHPGIVNQLAGFFSSRDINIHELYTDSYRAAHTGTQMFSANMVIHLPASVSIAQLREDFLDFCDQLNLDAVMEPYKN